MREVPRRWGVAPRTKSGGYRINSGIGGLRYEPRIPLSHIGENMYASGM